MSLTLTPEQRQTVHPLWLRLTHWLNALAMLIMVTSGWRIYNASPLFNFSFLNELTLGGWLGGALQWHFAGMWLFGVNGLCYLLINGQRAFQTQVLAAQPTAVSRRCRRAARQAATRRPAPLQHGATRGLSVGDDPRRDERAVRAGAVEIGAVSAAAHAARRL